MCACKEEIENIPKMRGAKIAYNFSYDFEDGSDYVLPRQDLPVRKNLVKMPLLSMDLSKIV